MYTCFICSVLFFIQRFKILVSVAEQAVLNLTWSKIPEDTFLRDVAQIKSSEQALLFFGEFIAFKISLSSIGSSKSVLR